MAAVYAATNLRKAKRVAAKVLHGELMAVAGLRERFVREGYVANSVEHAGTVRILDNDRSDDGAVFLIMELLEGETLRARWERHDRRLSVPETVGFVRDLLDVLAAMHDKGVIHRDIKPENLFLTREGRLKVLDFGIARLRQNSATQTLVGSTLGTPAFMPPEQALGRHDEVDALSDLWAVGATAFSLLSGRFVHESATVEEALINAATLSARPLASVVPPSVPPGIARVIDRALAFDKWDRWQSARAMREALVRAMDEVTCESQVVGYPGRKRHEIPSLPGLASIRRRRIFMGAAAATTAVVTGFAIHILAGFSARRSAPSVSPARLESTTALSSASSSDGTFATAPSSGQPPPEPAEAVAGASSPESPSGVDALGELAESVQVYQAPPARVHAPPRAPALLPLSRGSNPTPTAVPKQSAPAMSPAATAPNPDPLAP